MVNLVLNQEENGFMMEGIPAFNGHVFLKAMSFHWPEGLAAVRDESGAYHIDFKGRPLYHVRYLESYGFYGGFATVRDTHGFFHIDTHGSSRYHLRFGWAGNFQEGLCVVCTEEGYFHIDDQGQAAYPERYRYVGDFKYGIAVAHTDQGAFHILKDGSRLNQHQYKDAQPFHKGFSVVMDETGYYHVNKFGLALHGYRFQSAEPFYNGIARCRKTEGQTILLRENGNYTYEPVAGSGGRIDGIEISKKLALGNRVALYLRHAERFPRASGTWGNDLLLTPKGCDDARTLGHLLKGAWSCRFFSSPIKRCCQTASAIASALLGRDLLERDLNIDQFLGDPGPFSNTLSSVCFSPDTFSSVIDEYIETGYHEGLYPLSQCCENIVSYLVDNSTSQLNVFVTHDFFVAGLERFLGLRHPKHNNWVDYLEGVAWIDDGTKQGKWHILNGCRSTMSK